ncbi:Hypothetical predicted protein, partial [Marmota monax]
ILFLRPFVSRWPRAARSVPGWRQRLQAGRPGRRRGLEGRQRPHRLKLRRELFVETIAKDAYCCAQQGKRKTLQRRDLDNAIEAVDEFAFLEGTLD